MSDQPLRRPGTEPSWVKSSDSFANGNCLEVAALPDGIVGVRNSRVPGTMLELTEAEWKAFLGGAKRGEFDLPIRK